MEPKDNAQLQFYGQLIRHNHFNFYKKICENCMVKSGGTKDYKYLMNEQMEWPNLIYDLQLEKDNTDLVMEEIALKIQAEELPRFLIIDSFAKSENFEKAARKSGFMPVMRWPGMVFELNLSENTLILPQDFTISKVQNISELREWVLIVNKTLFPGKGLNAEILGPLLHSTGMSFLLAKYKGTPVSTMLLNTNGNTAGIFMASTLPDFTRKGFMSAILHYVGMDACKQGLSYLILEASGQSHKLYSTFGFKEVCNFDIYWKMN
jgi:hypothetical protein